jgi:hypothetical protein
MMLLDLQRLGVPAKQLPKGKQRIYDTLVELSPGAEPEAFYILCKVFSALGDRSLLHGKTQALGVKAVRDAIGARGGVESAGLRERARSGYD